MRDWKGGSNVRPISKRVPSDSVVVTANVALLAAADYSFRQFLTRALDIYSDGGAGVDGITGRNGSRLFSTFAQEGFPAIALVREPVGMGGRMTVALVSDY